MTDNTVKKNLSVKKAFDILEVMANHGEPMRIQDLSIQLGMSTATVYRFLKTLIDSEYVIKNTDSSKYSLTLKLCYIASMIYDHLNIREIIYPFLKELSNHTGETASLVIEQDNMAVYIDKVESTDKLVKSFQRIGYRAPLYCTGVGKIFLSQMDTNTKNIILNRELEKLTHNTITDRILIEEELTKIKYQGYAMDNEECEIGARCIAVPIRDYTKKIIAAISISGPTTRMTDQKIEEIKTNLFKASREISKILGYKESV